MQVQKVIPCLAFLVASIQAVSITQSFEEAQEEWKQFEQYFGNVALSEQCCSTIFDDIEKIVHIPALIKPIAMSTCQQIPGSGKEACGTICSALAPFGIEGPCHQVCDQAMESIHCENGVTGNDGTINEEKQQIDTLPIPIMTSAPTNKESAVKIPLPSVEEPTFKEEWNDFERYFGNVEISKQCCNTIFDLIGKIHKIPRWIKAAAKAACRAVPGSGHQVCGAICSALKPFKLKGPCEQVCDEAMKTAHCESASSENEVTMNQDDQGKMTISQSKTVSIEAKQYSEYPVQSFKGFFKFDWNMIVQ